MSELLTKLETTPIRDVLKEGAKSKTRQLMGKVSLYMAGRKVDKIMDADFANTDPDDDARIEQDEAYESYRDNLVASYQHDKADKKEYKKQRRKYILGRIGSAAMRLPGIDMVGYKLKERRATKRVDRERSARYIKEHGTLVGRQMQIHRENKTRHTQDHDSLKHYRQIVRENSSLWNQ